MSSASKKLDSIDWDVIKLQVPKVSRIDVIDTLEKLLRASTFVFENKLAAQRAVLQMKQGNADFSDYLIAEVNHQQGCTETATFDAKLRGLEGIRSLS